MKSLKMTVFWGVVPCSLVDIDDVSELITASIFRAMSLPDYTVQHPRRQLSSAVKNFTAFMESEVQTTE
jgi:hypothetical protein